MTQSIYCGVDTGGTFTDCILVADGRITSAKAPSTPNDFSIGFFDALERAGAELGLTLAELAPRLSHLVYGTTVATNIVVQRNGARTGLLTTEGFGDTLLMMRAIGRVTGLPPERLMRPSATSKPEPLVPRTLIAEVRERIDCFGDVVVPLDPGSCVNGIERLLAQDVEAIAIAFLWSFANPEHELAARALVREFAPDIYVSCSHEIAPRLGEYERTATTAINAYVGPATSAYMARISKRADALRVGQQPLILQCSGGAIPITQVAADAVRTIGSGPASGVIASVALARRLGISNVICADVGGTTFDVGLVRNSEPLLTDSSVISQYRYFTPSIDVESIGAGGGSIAWVESASKALRVGPHSAGAEPGPASYGRGGVEATVTDACLVLGYLGSENLLAGRVRLDPNAGRDAVARLAGPLGLSVEETAAGIVHIAEMTMADLIRKVTIQRGYDPSDFALFAYGGGGPVHAGAFGRELGVDRVVIPLGDNASLWSAFGAAASDVRRVFELSRVLDAPLAEEELRNLYDDVSRKAEEWLSAQGFSAEHMSLQRHASLRYKAQVHQVTIPVDGGRVDSEAAARIVAAFETAYESLYGEGTGYRDAGIELTSVRVTGIGAIPKPEFLSQTERGGAVTRGRRLVWWSEQGERVDTDVYWGADLTVGEGIVGPAIVEFRDTTLVVHPYQAAQVDPLGNVELVFEV